MKKKTIVIILASAGVLLVALLIFFRFSEPPLPPLRLDLSQPVLSQPTATVDQAKKWAKRNHAADLFIELADTYWEIGEQTGVNPTIAYAQAALETNFMNFGGVVDASYHNPCGLKTTTGGDDDDPDAHHRFADWSEGIRAQYEHLALYAGQDGYPLESPNDPRHFSYLFGEARTVGEIGDRWASSSNYAEVLAELVDRMEVTPE